jgi:hypothetical protein
MSYSKNKIIAISILTLAIAFIIYKIIKTVSTKASTDPEFYVLNINTDSYVDRQQQINQSQDESFRYQSSTPTPAELTNGNYVIQNKDGIVLASIAFTPVQCNNFLINYKPNPSKDDSWNLHQVSKGIYMLKKPGGDECLYASIGNTLKSYFLTPGCQSKKVCGLESLDEKDQLDEESKRTYFEIWNYEEKGYVIKSVETGKYICVEKGKATFSSNPTDNCLFNIKQM